MNQSLHKLRNLLTLLVLGMSLASCFIMGDPGYKMEPVGMVKLSSGQWSKKFDGFELQTNGIHGLIGEWSFDPHLAISTGSSPITIESIELQSAKGIFQAELKDKFKVIPVLTSQFDLHAYWKFQDKTPAPVILGESGRIVIHLKVGNVDLAPEIEYKKVSCCS